MSAPLSFQSLVVVVVQPVKAASAGSAPPAWFGPPFEPSVARVAFHPFRTPPEPLSDMGRADARSAEIDRPAGVARSFQVSLYKVEPSEAVLARNLFAKDDARPELCDEVVEGWPKVPLVSKPAAFACRAERLAGAASGPDGAIVGPSGATERMAPDADAGEEMALRVPAQLVGSNILDAPFVNVAGRDVAGGN